MEDEIRDLSNELYSEQQLELAVTTQIE